MKIVLAVCVLILFASTYSSDVEEDYDYGDTEALEDCQYEIDFKTYKKTSKLDLCSSLTNPTANSRIQLHVYANYTEEKIHIRALSSSLTNSPVKKSLVSLTTDITEDFTCPASILTIDDYQWISLPTLKSILTSLINADLNLLGKNLKKTLIVAKGGHKDLLNCAGNFYAKQDEKVLNITLTFTKPITCTKEKPQDRFFTYQEKTYLNQADEKKFRLADLHQDDPKKISRTAWYTCNNPKSCSLGVQKKANLDKTATLCLDEMLSSRKLALVIGNNSYEVGKKLNCCLNDALDIGNVLEKFDFQVTVGVDLPYVKMVQKVLQFQRQVQKNDLLLIFYSGHGAQWEDQHYLIGIDNKCLSDDFEMYPHYAISIQSTLESMMKRQPCTIILLLDCCRNNLNLEDQVSNTKNVSQENVTDVNLTSMKSIPNTLIVFACGSNEVTLENSKNARNSLFTYHLLKHIIEPNLNVEEVMSRVCHGIYEDTNGQSCSYRLSSLRTSNVFFHTSSKDMPLYVPLPSCHENKKLEEEIEKCNFQSIVDLDHWNLTDNDMEIVVAQAIIKKQCRRLYLQNNNITSYGALRIAVALENNITLNTLNLNNNHLSDVGVRYLAEKISSSQSILQYLDLGSNEITDLGVQHIIEIIKRTRTLTFLGLACNDIGNQGMQLLINVILQENSQIEELCVNGNRLIDDLCVDPIVQMLKSNRSLRRFRIHNCNLSKKFKRKLRRAIRWKFFLSVHA
ncbi:unnamed protein product [Adineta ricciae]|uniref:Caspase family p20 domain-containing protein n=1 Tax=Adineta ricciae TaxID=249248 RepID=A0A815JTS1_ADIRI|nr:unnamed protein product [Adineta ricciae]